MASSLFLVLTLLFQKVNLLTATNVVMQCKAEGSSCPSSFQKAVFATTHPLRDRNMTKSLFSEMADQGDNNQTCGLGSKYILMGSCSQIHQPFTWNHPMPGLNVSLVEWELQRKWQNVMNEETSWQFDAFFDNAVAYFVLDLTYWYRYWKSIDADLILLRWYADSDVDQTHPFYSILTHNAHGLNGTLSQFELISDSFDYDDDILFLESEMRAFLTFDDINFYRDSIGVCELLPIGVRRSVSDLDENLDWYRTMWSPTLDEESGIITGQTVDYAGNYVKYAHVKIESNIVNGTFVSFFERSAGASFGDFAVRDWENGMKAAHDLIMKSPLCGIDRWFDMHYAIQPSDQSAARQVLETISLSGQRYTVFINSRGDAFVYMPEPGGQSVQLILKSAADSIDWVVEPTIWAADWCPMNCTKHQQNLTFGEPVFVYKTSPTSGLTQYEIDIFDLALAVVAGLLAVCGIMIWYFKVFLVSGMPLRCCFSIHDKDGQYVLLD